MDSVAIFFQTTLQVDAILTDRNKMTEEERKYFLERMEARRQVQKKAMEEKVQNS